MPDFQPALGGVVSAPRFTEPQPVMPRHLLDELVAKKPYELPAGETILSDAVPADVLTCPEAGRGSLPSPALPGVPSVAPGRVRSL